MDNIALLGGGFNPICLHHEFIVSNIQAHTKMKTWVMPCFSHKFSKNNNLLSPEHRWNMTKAVADYNSIYHKILIPLDWEIKHKHSGSMYETIQQLKKEYPNTKIHLVIGMDNANIIETKWDRGSLLIQENPFIVINRPSIVPATRWFLDKPHQVINLSYDISSSDVRNAIETGNYEYAQQHLNPAVWNYIKINQLYGFKNV